MTEFSVNEKKIQGCFCIVIENKRWGVFGKILNELKLIDCMHELNLTMFGRNVIYFPQLVMDNEII